MKKFLIALQFLTIFPVKIRTDIKNSELAGSLAFFPLVGLVIGIVAVGVSFVTGFLPIAIRAAIILAVFCLITGGLHLDGLADSADALYGVRKKESRLDILRDSRIGVMGALSLILIILLKYSIFVSVSSSGLWRWLLIMPMTGRWAQVIVCYFSKPARKDGKALPFISQAKKKDLFIATLVTLILGYLIIGFKGIIALSITFIFVRLTIIWISKRIGGMTGDTIGAVSELSEVFVGVAFYV